MAAIGCDRRARWKHVRWAESTRFDCECRGRGERNEPRTSHSSSEKQAGKSLCAMVQTEEDEVRERGRGEVEGDEKTR